MQNADNIKVLDFNSFKQQREQAPETQNMEFTPMLVWYPMWVMVPNQPAPPTSNPA